MDSFILIELVGLFEAKLGVKIPPMEVNLKHFDTVERMLTYLGTKSA